MNVKTIIIEQIEEEMDDQNPDYATLQSRFQSVTKTNDNLSNQKSLIESEDSFDSLKQINHLESPSPNLSKRNSDHIDSNS